MQRPVSATVVVCASIFAIVGPAWGRDLPAAQAAPGVTEPAAQPDIIVTADKRSQSIQAVAASVTAITGASLKSTEKTRLDDVLQGVSGVKIQTISNGIAIAIRGVGVETTPGLGDPAAATNYDDVYSERGEDGRLSFFDINRVEVLRGPQGTLYGRNSTAGVVNILSNDPVNRFAAAATFGLGNFGDVQSEAMANVPLGSDLAVRGSFFSLRHTGYLSNGQQDADDFAGRLKVLFTPTADVKLLIGGQIGSSDTNGTTGVPAFISAHGYQTWTTDNPSPNSYTFDTKKIYAKLDVNLGFATLTAIPAFQTFDADTATNFGAFFIRFHSKETQKSAELRLAGGSHLKWTIGGFYYNADPDSLTTSPITQDQAIGVKSYAGFGELTLPLNDAISVTAGGRYTSDQKNITINQVVAGTASSSSLNKTFEHADYKVELSAHVAPRSLLYAKVSTGFRSGGLYATGANGAFQPEKLTSYEAGSKNVFLNGRLTANFDIFYYDYRDYQATNTVFIGGAPVQAIFNAPGAKTYGAELLTNVAVTPHDAINFNAAYLHARFRDGFVFQGVDYSDKPLGHSPTWQLAGGYDHTFSLHDSGTIVLHGDLTYETSSYVTFVENPFSKQHQYTQSNASLRYATANKHWSASLWVKNIENVAVKAQYLSQGPSIPLLAPRTFGGTVGVNF